MTRTGDPDSGPGRTKPTQARQAGRQGSARACPRGAVAAAGLPAAPRAVEQAEPQHPPGDHRCGRARRRRKDARRGGRLGQHSTLGQDAHWVTRTGAACRSSSPSSTARPRRAAACPGWSSSTTRTGSPSDGPLPRPPPQRRPGQHPAGTADPLGPRDQPSRPRAARPPDGAARRHPEARRRRDRPAGRRSTRAPAPREVCQAIVRAGRGLVRRRRARRARRGRGAEPRRVRPPLRGAGPASPTWSPARCSPRCAAGAPPAALHRRRARRSPPRPPGT